MGVVSGCGQGVPKAGTYAKRTEAELATACRWLHACLPDYSFMHNVSISWLHLSSISFGLLGLGGMD